jgi:Ca-activated chloride channel homolog
VILLLAPSDNSTGRTQPLDAAADAKQLGVAIFAIALGTDTGMVDVPDENGQLRRVPVPPDPTTLHSIAEQTGGRSFAAVSDRDLKSIYDDLGSRIGFVKQHEEITVALSAAAVVPLAAGGMLSLLWFNRFL